MDDRSQRYLDNFLKSLPEPSRNKYHSFSSDYFCGDEYNANLCAELIKQGKKTATCSMAYWYESGEEPMPTVGHLQVVVDWHGNPVCIIEIDTVTQCPYNEVTDEFARAEGEKCARSWKFSTEIGSDTQFPDVTPRDAKALRELASAGLLDT